MVVEGVVEGGRGRGRGRVGGGWWVVGGVGGGWWWRWKGGGNLHHQLDLCMLLQWTVTTEGLPMCEVKGGLRIKSANEPFEHNASGHKWKINTASM